MLILAVADRAVTLLLSEELQLMARILQPITTVGLALRLMELLRRELMVAELRLNGMEDEHLSTMAVEHLVVVKTHGIQKVNTTDPSLVTKHKSRIRQETTVSGIVSILLEPLERRTRAVNQIMPHRRSMLLRLRATTRALLLTA